MAQLVNISPQIAFQKEDTKLYSHHQCVRMSDSLFGTGVTVGTTGLVLICIFLIESVTTLAEIFIRLYSFLVYLLIFSGQFSHKVFSCLIDF